jgi:hypothetical protein
MLKSSISVASLYAAFATQISIKAILQAKSVEFGTGVSL